MTTTAPPTPALLARLAPQRQRRTEQERHERGRVRAVRGPRRRTPQDDAGLYDCGA